MQINSAGHKINKSGYQICIFLFINAIAAILILLISVNEYQSINQSFNYHSVLSSSISNESGCKVSLWMSK